MSFSVNPCLSRSAFEGLAPPAASGAMRLVGEGKLALDQPIQEVVTRWRLPLSKFDARKVTLRRILSHTAGLSLHGYPGFRGDEDLPTLEESLSGATGGRGEVRLIHEPGSKFEYSGDGYTLMQLAIEEVSGQDFATYMRNDVLRPLEMKSSDFLWNDALKDMAAASHDEHGNPR